MYISCNSCNNYRHTYIISNEKEKEKEKEIDSSNKIHSSYLNETTKGFFRINNNTKKLMLLKQKTIDLEDKLKTEKLKYLFCIGEQHKKIKELEKELNKKSVDSMTQDELKQYRCFPNYKKFDVLDKYTQQSKSKSKDKNKNIYNKRYKNYLLEQEQNENLNRSEKEEDIINNTKEIIKCGEKVLNKKEFEGNKYIDKEGNYFISHPKLKYIKDDLNMKTWKTNEIIDSLPKDIMRHKFSSKSQKNNLIVFPSSLNQIIVNLEKLRIHNDFRRIDMEFKENETKNIKKI